MSITVVISRNDDGAPTTREVYAEGVKFTTEGGDLAIVSGRPSLLGVYGSGNWLSVYVDDFVEVITTKSEPDDDDDDDFSFGGIDDDSSSDNADSDSSDTDSESSADEDSSEDSAEVA